MREQRETNLTLSLATIELLIQPLTVRTKEQRAAKIKSVTTRKR